MATSLDLPCASHGLHSDQAMNLYCAYSSVRHSFPWPDYEDSQGASREASQGYSLLHGSAYFQKRQKPEAHLLDHKAITNRRSSILSENLRAQRRDTAFQGASQGSWRATFILPKRLMLSEKTCAYRLPTFLALYRSQAERSATCVKTSKTPKVSTGRYFSDISI